MDPQIIAALIAAAATMLTAAVAEQWLHGSFGDIVALQDRCFPDELITMDRTSELWVRRSPQPVV